MAVLIAESDVRLREALAWALARAGFGVEQKETLTAALEALGQRRFEAAVLEWPERGPQPQPGGFRVGSGATPVIATTPRRAPAAKIAALLAGAVDAVEKPLNMDEIVARVRAVAR